jgi:hypothetical protein
LGECEAPGWPRCPCDQKPEDGSCADSENCHVGADAGGWLGRAGCPDRHQRRRGDRHCGGCHRPGGCGHPHFDQPAAHYLAARHAKRRQRRVVRCARGQQARGHLADDEERGNYEHEREEGERYRLGPDGTLDGRRLRVLIRDEHMSLRAGEPARQCLRAAAEAVRRGARLQRHKRPVGGQVAGAEVVHESSAGEDHRDLVEFSDRLHR